MKGLFSMCQEDTGVGEKGRGESHLQFDCLDDYMTLYVM